MNIPGFTAETSLYKTSEHYQIPRIVTAMTIGGDVVPQQEIGTMNEILPQAVKVCKCPCCIQVAGNLVCCD